MNEEVTEAPKRSDTESRSTERDDREAEANEPGEEGTLMRSSRELGNNDNEGQDRSASRAEVASGIERSDINDIFVRRAGFGVLHETKPLRRGDRLGSA